MKKRKKSKETVDPGCPFIEVNNKDVLQKIMKYLCANDVVALGSTCQKMRALSNSESVWFHFLTRDYGVEKDPVFDGKTTNKEIYKQEKQFEEMLSNNSEKDLGENLCLSCENGLLNNVKCCIRRGVNIDQVDKYGWTALMGASRYGNEEVVELLLNKGGANIDHVSNYGMTALMYASFKGNEEVVELLLNKGANIDQVDKYGWTALMRAS